MEGLRKPIGVFISYNYQGVLRKHALASGKARRYGKKVITGTIRSQAPKSDIVRIWGRFNDFMTTGMR